MGSRREFSHLTFGLRHYFVIPHTDFVILDDFLISGSYIYKMSEYL